MSAKRLSDEAIGKKDERNLRIDPRQSDILAEQERALGRAALRVKGLEEELGRRLTACVVNMGCQMNARDSEKLAGILEAAGFAITDSEDSDFLIYNTSPVRENADKRLFGRLGAVGALKRGAAFKRIAVCGCMMQEDVNIKRLLESYPFVDLIFGTHNLFTFPALLEAVLAPENEGAPIVDVWEKTDTVLEGLPSKRKYSFKSGVNIMFGCDNFCSYCIVPYVRGRERSRRRDEILDEVRGLVEDGVKEVMLLGQNVNSYGRKVDDPADYGSFPELLSRVAEIPGLFRLRFMTSHPKDLSDELIEVMRSHETIARHLHLPLQSGSNRILKRMNRNYTREAYIELALRIKERVPGIAITTDLISGFPGETGEDVDDTLDVIERVRFQNAYTFIYSRRSGTPAADFEDQIPREEAQRGFERVLAKVQEIARKECASHVGETGEVLVEGMESEGGSLLTGRLSCNLLVHFAGPSSLVGKVQTVRLKESRGFYYMGEMV